VTTLRSGLARIASSATSVSRLSSTIRILTRKPPSTDGTAPARLGGVMTFIFDSFVYPFFR
jgi:hypothetical protein